MDPSDVWTGAGVVLGFQAASFLWRIGNEVTRSRELKNAEPTWLPPADILNLIGMTVMVLGVFIAPLSGYEVLIAPNEAFGLAVLLFVGHCFALAGHYDMYNPRTVRSMVYFPFQERVAVVVVFLAACTYLVLVLGA